MTSQQETATIRILTYIVILSISIILIHAVISWARTDAPGAQTAPRQSQDGKREAPDPGGSFLPSFFFEHNAFSQRWTQAKLFPGLRQTTRMYMDGQIIFGGCVWVNQLFNIITIIHHKFKVRSCGATKLYLVELSTLYQQYNTITSLSRVRNLSETGIESWIWTVHSACCAVCSHGNDKYVQ